MLCRPCSKSIRENLNNTLTRKFVDEMKEYQNAQQKYKSDIKKKVKRQVQIVKPDATNEEIDAVMKSEGGRDALYKDKILTGVADPIKWVWVYLFLTRVPRTFSLVLSSSSKCSNNVEHMWLCFFFLCRNAYANVAGKYQDVLALEASVTELHQMFQDFALLTEQQGELLNQIEFQVETAADYIEEGNVDIVKSIEYQKSIRKKQW